MEKVACYIRVSTQEQKLHGISLDAQREKLKEYAENHHLKIVEWYEDEGVSGRKLIKNRPELQRMLNDAQRRKFDRIIFIKLDRFFRSVAEYHECMKLIDPVLWTATEEKYDLTTANGRAFVNMKLTIAELEADQTGERIDIVNDYKIKTGQAITGAQRQGFAYTVKKIDGIKRVVKDPETEAIVNDYINHFLTHSNKRQAYLYVKEKYDTPVTYCSLSKVLNDTKIYGSYRGNDNYCEPYVDKETFDKIQVALKRNIKKTGANRTYLFSGIVTCPCCGRALTGKYNGGIKRTVKPSGKVYVYMRDYYAYRCNNNHMNNCTFNKQPREDIIEKELLSNFDKLVNIHINNVDVIDTTVKKSNVSNKIKQIKSEMTRVNNMYRKERISEEQYDRDYDELQAQLKELESYLEPEVVRDLSMYENILKTDWRAIYTALDKEHKRSFWHKFIKEIHFELNGDVKDVKFF